MGGAQPQSAPACQAHDGSQTTSQSRIKLRLAQIKFEMVIADKISRKSCSQIRQFLARKIDPAQITVLGLRFFESLHDRLKCGCQKSLFYGQALYKRAVWHRILCRHNLLEGGPEGARQEGHEDHHGFEHYCSSGHSGGRRR